MVRRQSIVFELEGRTMKSILILFASLLASLSTAHGKEIWVTMDQARPYKFAKPVGRIVIGNPSIADLQVQSSEDIMLFGRAPGLTNIYLFDQSGEPMGQLEVRVKNPTSRMVTVQMGVGRQTYSCTDVCEPTLALGDGALTIEATPIRQQIQQKFELATQAANGSTVTATSNTDNLGATSADDAGA